MAKLISYKRQDENRYSTFSNVSLDVSTDNLQFRSMSKKSPLNVPAAVHKSSVARKGTIGNKKLSCRNRMRRITCCWQDRKWIRVILRSCSYCCQCNKSESLNNDDDIDAAVVEYKNRQGISVGSQTAESQRSTLNSEKGASRFWSWDDSWKSNSDKFLESLELDCVGTDRSLKRKLRLLRQSKVRGTAFQRFGGGGGFDGENRNYTLIHFIY